MVGTTDAVRTVVQSHTQIRSVFSNPLVLEPLGLGDVEQLRGWHFKPEFDLISKVSITEH